VVTPDAKFLDVSYLRVGLQSQLSKGSVVIQSSHGSEILLGDALSVVLEDEAVSVSRVSDDDSLASSLGVIAHGFANTNKDLSIIFEEISTLHTWATGLGTNHECVINILESNGGVTGAYNLIKKRESAIVQLSSNTSQGFLGEWEIN
jgi:hypothetical protein